MTLAALVALLALAAAGFSLWRLSRLPQAEAPVEDRTFATLRKGDLVLTPDGGDWLVEDRLEAEGALKFALRSGREKRWLWVPPEGAVALSAEPDKNAARQLDRGSVELLPGA
jgi:hypothetical protein